MRILSTVWGFLIPHRKVCPDQALCRLVLLPGLPSGGISGICTNIAKSRPLPANYRRSGPFTVTLSNTGILMSTLRMRFRHQSRINSFLHICPLMICSGSWLRSRRIRCWAYAIAPCLKHYTQPVSGCLNWLDSMFKILIFMNMSFG